MSLIETTQPPASPALPDTLRLGAVHLTVADLDRSVAWYQRSLGLRVHTHDLASAELGDGSETVVVLHEDPQARPAGRHAGLYHYALLYPTREELARAAVRLAHTRTPIQGASDHRTHEAIYLPDADGNGIELAWDREREQWPAGLGYDRGPGPLDFDSLLNTVAGEQPTDFVGEGLRMGHLHLHVGDIERALALLPRHPGLRGPGAPRLGSVRLRRRLPPPPGHQRLERPGRRRAAAAHRRPAPLDRPAADRRRRRRAARARRERAGQAVELVDGGFEVRDPWGTALAVIVGRRQR